MTRTQSAHAPPAPLDLDGKEPSPLPESAALVRRYFDMWNSGDGKQADALLGPTYVDHAHPDVLGPAALRSLVPRLHAADPAARWTVEIAAADMEYVTAHATVTRVVQGSVRESRGVALFRVADGKLAEQWSWYPEAMWSGAFGGDRR